MSNIVIFIPTLKKGGAEKQAALLANALGQQDKVFFVLLYPELGMEKELLYMIPLGGACELVKLKGGFVGKMASLYRVLKDNNVETMFCYLSQPNLLGCIIGRLAGVGKIYQGIRSTFLPASKLFAEKILSRFSTGVIVNCYSGKEIFAKQGIHNITVIPNCYLNAKEYIKRKQQTQVNIISVGRFVEDKDYRVALEAVVKLKDSFSVFKYIIVGYGELENDIRKWVDELGLSDSIDILINPQGIPSLLDKADIYLSTSLFEGTSNSIMEALDASLPIVATNVGDNYMMVEQGENGFLTAIKDTESLAENLLKLAENYDLRVVMGKRSNELLKERYSLERFRNNYLKLL